jgi:DNA-binding NarL/FixJ family response regulator
MEQSNTIGLVLADGHPIVLHGLRHCFRWEADLDVVACCTSDEATLRAVDACDPVGLVLDLRLPESGGLRVLRTLSAQRRSTRVVLLADSITEHEMSEAIRLGVRGVILKAMAPALLIQCVRQVCQGGMWFEHETFGSVIAGMHRREAGVRDLRQRLTRREVEVLQLLAAGHTNGEITGALKIAEGTVKIHVHNLYEKLGTRNRLQLALRARESGLV